MSTEIEKKEAAIISVDSYEFGKDKLPDLNEAIAFPISLGGEYWTPQNINEKKRVFLQEIKYAKVTSINTNEEIDLECVFLSEQDESLNTKTIYNGSRILVGIIASCIELGRISTGTPLEITYLGKRKNKKNGFSSDNWDVKPLIFNIPTN